MTSPPQGYCASWTLNINNGVMAKNHKNEQHYWPINHVWWCLLKCICVQVIRNFNYGSMFLLIGVLVNLVHYRLCGRFEQRGEIFLPATWYAKPDKIYNAEYLCRRKYKTYYKIVLILFGKWRNTDKLTVVSTAGH